MTPFFYTYILLWVTACVTALILMYQNHKSIILFQKNYRDFLKIKWKLTTFIIATSAFVILTPYAGIPTWDYFNAVFMSILTFISAPWSIGTLFRFIKRQEKLKIAYITVCAWMFSTSWSYDIYLVFRDGAYPNTWLPNIFASGVIYASAGLFWNLEYREGRGVIFGFMENDWPNTNSATGFNKILFYAMPFMILAAAVFVPFFI